MKPQGIKLSAILMLFTFFIISNNAYLSSNMNNLIKAGMVMLILPMLLLYPVNRTWQNGWPAFLYFLSILLSSIANYSTFSKLASSAVYAFSLLIIYLITEIAVQENGVSEIIHLLFVITTIILLVANFCVIFTNGVGIGTDGTLPLFLVGNKFVVSYYNMFFLCLYMIRSRGRKPLKILLLAVFCLVTCYKADCATGMVGIFFMVVFYILLPVFKRIFAKPLFLLIALGLSSLPVFFYNLILTNSSVRYFITDWLHRNLTITGRVQIYSVLPGLIPKKPFVGYGYANTIVAQIVGYGNTQNGIFNLLIDFGIVGLIAFAILCFQSVKAVRPDSNPVTFPILCYLYAMIICATVEINLSTMFVLGLSLIRACENDKAQGGASRDDHAGMQRESQYHYPCL